MIRAISHFSCVRFSYFERRARFNTCNVLQYHASHFSNHVQHCLLVDHYGFSAAARSDLSSAVCKQPNLCSSISVVSMTGVTIAIDDASASDTILSVKERVHAANRKLPVYRQKLVYRPGPRGMKALANDETLGGAGVAQDGSAELDVLLDEMNLVEKQRWFREVLLSILAWLTSLRTIIFYQTGESERQGSIVVNFSDHPPARHEF
jgi:hypothetical protein